MKKLILFALLAFGAAFATPTYYDGTGSKTVETLSGSGYAVLAIDVLLGPGDTAYSRPFDVIRTPIMFRDTGLSSQSLLYDYGQGATLLTCYDQRDSAGVVDSVNVSFIIQISRFAGDNSDPNGTGESGNKSDTWSVPSAITANGASDASAFVDAALQGVFVTTQGQRYVRYKVYNNKTTPQNASRCRIYWYRRPMLR
jgi:hypothetical protein